MSIWKAHRDLDHCCFRCGAQIKRGESYEIIVGAAFIPTYTYGHIECPTEECK